MTRNDNVANRFGSSRFANVDDLEKAGLFQKHPHSIFLGFFEGRPVYFHGPAGLTITAGARGGKMRDVIARNLLATTCLHTIMMLDPKGEGAYLSQDQTRDGKYCGYWNPIGLHDLPQDRINPFEHLTTLSPTLVSDMKVLWENLIASSGASQAGFFEARAREYGEAIALTVTEIAGVLSYPSLFEAINLLIAGGEQWLDIAYQMSQSRFPLVRRIEAEIATSREDSTGGFRGIIGELARSVACLTDPLLMASVSPPYTMSLSDLTSSDQAWQFYLMPPAEFISAWSPVLKSFLVGVMLLKSRAPAAPRITFFLDECGQLAGGGAGGFPLLPRLFTYGAGIGVQPVAVLQSNRQMREFGPDAQSLIQSSAAAKLMFAIRDIESATDCAKLCGSQTLVYDDHMAQERAHHARNGAVQALLSGGDPLQAGFALSHHGFAAEHQTKQHRQLRQPEEIINTPTDRAYLFHEEVPFPIELERRPYWTDRTLAGLYHPNPYHPPLDRVSVQTRWGQRSRRVITGPVAQRFAHLPQYRSGLWSRVKV